MKLTVLIEEERIQARVRDLGASISQDYKNEGIAGIVVLGILKGSFVFMADLIRSVNLPFVDCQFLGVSSYGNATESSGEVKITHDLSHPVKGQHILLVEDIADTGLTLTFIQRLMKSRGAASVRTACFLSKPEKHKGSVVLDYVGFEIGSEFVVGYGLDSAGNYRHLPYVGIVHPPTVS